MDGEGAGAGVRACSARHGRCRDEAAAFLKINPAGRVPAIDDDGCVMAESLAINLYLARKYGDRAKPSLAPASLEEEAKIWQWSSWAMTDLEGPMNRSICIAASSRRRSATPRWPRARKRRFSDRWRMLEAMLAESAYLLGPRFTVADLNVACVLSASRAGDHRHVARFRMWPAWAKSCHERPASAGSAGDAAAGRRLGERVRDQLRQARAARGRCRAGRSARARPLLHQPGPRESAPAAGGQGRRSRSGSGCGRGTGRVPLCSYRGAARWCRRSASTARHPARARGRDGRRRACGTPDRRLPAWRRPIWRGRTAHQSPGRISACALRSTPHGWPRSRAAAGGGNASAIRRGHRTLSRGQAPPRSAARQPTSAARTLSATAASAIAKASRAI